MATQVRAAPVAHLLTVAVIAVALALPLGLFVVVDNLRALPEQWGSRAQQISLYMKPAIDDARAVEFAAGLNGLPGIGAVELITRQEAWNEYRELSGFAEALAALDTNPLPALVVIDPAAGADAQALLDDLRRRPEVEVARLDTEWIERLGALMSIARRAILLLAGVLGLTVALIASHTIRLAVLQRREEMEIAKLFGATDAYIRRPFVYLGLGFGAAGGALACAIVAIALALMAAPVRALLTLYPGEFTVTPIGGLLAAAVTAGAGLLGMIGAWVSAAQVIRAVEVR
jgi:cell division transport system permease protein